MQLLTVDHHHASHLLPNASSSVTRLCSKETFQGRRDLKNLLQSEISLRSAETNTCYHDLQLSYGWIRGVGQEDVDVSHHALRLLHTGVRPALLIQHDEGALCKVSA